MTSSTANDEATATRYALVDRLLADGKITSPQVAAAFRAVPRHEFVPDGTSLEAAYNADDSVVTKRDEHGVTVSSVSAPFIQALMIEQARVAPGMSVLEIGSGGYNAALVAEVVGPDGHVVSVDIDPEVTDRARALLDATGYADRVIVVRADAAQPLAGHGPFDAVIVTVGAWDIAPAWLTQLKEAGRLVLPLVMNGVTRSIAFRRDGDHLVSESAEVCGFVAMQGEGGHPERILQLPDSDGHQVKLRFDARVPEHPHLLDGVLGAGRSQVWSGVTIPMRTSFADLHLWFAGFLRGFCLLAADEGTDLAREQGTWFPFGVVRGAGFAYLAVRTLPDDAGVEFGAGAYGADGHAAATAMVEQIQAWDRSARPGPEPTFAYWPTGSDLDQIPADAAVLEKTHGLVTISWPPMG